MADTKISALPFASTPLAGTEVLPIVQGGITEQVTVNDLTVRNVRASATTGILRVVGPAAGTTRTMTTPNANFTVARTDAAQSFTGNLTLSTGNLIIGTSGQGIDFSATPGTGTSELLADYEEGTWTATIFNGANNATMGGGGTCQYTKIGRLVTLHGYLYTTSLGSVTGDLNISGLPFTPLAGGVNFTASAVGFGDSLALLPGQSVGIRFTPSSTNAVLVVWDAATGSTTMQATEWTSNGELMFTATYLTAS